jgi:DNA processing protein
MEPPIIPGAVFCRTAQGGIFQNLPKDNYPLGGNIMEEKSFWVGLRLIKTLNNPNLIRLVSHFGSAEGVWKASQAEIASALDSEILADQVTALRQLIQLPQAMEQLRQRGIGVVTLADESYPVLLGHIYNPPPVLFYLGDMDRLTSWPVAVVGTRTPTPYGKKVALWLGEELARHQVTVISGMARGIDSLAHRGALNSGGVTAAVLGCGLDIVYPRENSQLMTEISGSGVVISEFPLGTPPEARNFPARNRIISGLALGTVVVEAAEKSGALITANVALEQGRDVMAVPGQITAPYSRGPNNLIKQGAAVVLGAGDIMAELGMGVLFTPHSNDSSGHLKMNEDEVLLSRLIEYEPVSVEMLVQKTGLPAGQVLTALMFLEMKGLIKQMPGRLYTRT